jgi:putative ABC transport system substrate-binding protein
MTVHLIRGVLVLFLSAGLAAAETIPLGLAWVGKAGMPERVEKGFTLGIDETEGPFAIEARRELPSLSELARIVDRWERKKRGMVILRSNGAKWLGKHPPAIPAFIGGCNHPVQLGAVENMDAPGGNITGVTYYINKEIQFDVFQTILPELESVYLLLEAAHPSTVIDRRETESICRRRNIRFGHEVFSEKAAVIEAVASKSGEVDAFIISAARLLIDNAAAIVEAAGDTPVFSFTVQPVREGALGGFVADDIKLGYMLADSVKAVLVDGTPIGEVPVKQDPEPRFTVNVKTAERLGLIIPYSILETAEIIE